MIVRRRAPSLHGLFFLGFCAVGAPLLVTGSIGCTSEAQASPPAPAQPTEASEVEARTQPAVAPAPAQPKPQITQKAYWREGNGVPIASYDAQQSLAPLIEVVQPAVVSIHTRSSRGRFAAAGMGSGFIISADGLVVTNHHVVAGNEKLEVHLPDGRRFEGTVIGSDPQTDLAVVRLASAKQLPTVVLGSSDNLRVGDWVLAMGSPMGLEHTVTRGIISAEGRGSLGLYQDGYADFLQTDAAINPGNSGGPLFDMEGRVLGINTAIVAAGQGIGFAVPIDLVRSTLPQLEKTGRVIRGYLGVAIQDVTPELAEALDLRVSEGALVASVVEGGPADEAGIRPGDVIVSLDGEPIVQAQDLTRRISRLPPSTPVRLGVQRGGREREVSLSLGERPEDGRRRAPSEPDEEDQGLGLQIGPVPSTLQRQLGIEGGVLVLEVRPGSRADRAGLMPEDVIVEVNRRPVTGPEEFVAAVRRAGREQLLLRVLRGEGAAYLVVPAAE